jgi:hypothetical protein
MLINTASLLILTFDVHFTITLIIVNVDVLKYSRLSLSRSHWDRPKNIEITKCRDKHIRVRIKRN